MVEIVDTCKGLLDVVFDNTYVKYHMLQTYILSNKQGLDLSIWIIETCLTWLVYVWLSIKVFQIQQSYRMFWTVLTNKYERCNKISKNDGIVLLGKTFIQVVVRQATFLYKDFAKKDHSAVQCNWLKNVKYSRLVFQIFSHFGEEGMLIEFFTYYSRSYIIKKSHWNAKIVWR